MVININQHVLIEKAESIVARTMCMDMTWDWPCGVAYYGISALYEATNEERYIGIMQERIDELISLGLPERWTVNTCAMGHCLLTLYEKTGEEQYWQLLMSKIDYLQHKALRFGPNVLQHTVSSSNDFPEQAWADTLFMAAFLMLRMGIKLEDEQLINDALNQYYWHIQYLQNPKTGLFYHGYDASTQTNLSGIYWARANAWSAYTMSQVGRILPKAYLYPKFMDILGSLDEQLSAVKYLQTNNGLWCTILDDQSSYEELSASAGLAASMTAYGNPLHHRYIERAIEGILSHVGDDGKVNDVSAGTAIMSDAQGYKDISKRWIQGWGQGLCLTLFAELLKLEDKNHEACTESSVTD
ncbi:glycoside hydrolase family 88/105 protein [Enterococcus sp. RIT-PI-f]|uniref:glycoside hydrolase family 88/105 protein n=1 Tax=Enterococcus sp. RIT-PI-f TaxID=1690244 RepID=UPI0006B9A463|nr:glycoside hydrolase family 88 protein [Enterococcus sp. RIT-PI-f]KPG73771.1 rhamnogalacturonyl hydrolase [Enterococcus sp. RIT-PI-f]